MRIKIVRGREPSGLCRYLLSLEKRSPGHEMENPIFHSNMFSDTAAELAEELRFSADLNARVKQTVCHYQISFPPKENPDLPTKRAIVEDLLAARSHGDNCQFFAVEHFDRVHKKEVHHLHVVTSAVRLDGTWVNGDFEWVELKQVERDLEQKHHLRDCLPKPIAQQKNLTNGESRLKDRIQAGLPEDDEITLPKEKLWSAIDQAIVDKPTMPVMVARLKTQGIEVQFHERIEDDERKLGLSFGIDGSKFQGYRLGKGYSFGGLKKYRGVSYQADRDDELLRQFNTMTGDECRSLLSAQAEMPPSAPALPEPIAQPTELETIAQPTELAAITPTAAAAPIAQPIAPSPEPELTTQPIDPEPTAQPIEAAPVAKTIAPASNPEREKLLHFVNSRLQTEESRQTKDKLYLTERDGERITISRLIDQGKQKGKKKGETILDATLTASGWEVAIDRMEPEDLHNFDRYQKHREQQQHQKPKQQKQPKRRQKLKERQKEL